VKIHRAFWLPWIVAVLLKTTSGYSQQRAADSTLAAKSRPFRGSLGLDSRFSGGNIRQFLIRFNAELFLEGKNFLINPNLLFTRNVIFGNKLESDVFSFLLFKAWHHARFYPVAALLYENSVVRSINSRYMGGVGAGWNLMASQTASLEVIQLMVYEKNSFDVNKNLDYKGVRTHTSLIGKYALLNNRLTVEHRLFYSVLLQDLENQRMRTFIILRVPLTKKFSLTASLDYMYESIVDERRASRNYTSTGGMSFHFK
jgi:hypothetical protein